MKELDFLPPEYRERNAAHQARLCQIVMVLAFGAVICLAAGYQLTLYRSAQHELALVAPRYDDAVAKTQQLAALRGEVEQIRQAATLYTFLDYPWPRTQILAEIAKHLPDQVTLRELTIVETTPQSGTTRGAIAVEIATATATTPAQADLALLHQQQDACRSEVQVSGTTTDSGALHLFVMALNGTPLFASAKLHSMEAVPRSDQSTFFVRLTVRPGYGQPGGPQAPRSIAAQGNPRGSLDRS